MRIEKNTLLLATDFFCAVCEGGFSFATSLQQHHVAVQNLCAVCDGFFNSPSDLINVILVCHRLPDVTAGCDRMFDKDSVMLLYLKAGTCPSVIDLSDVQAGRRRSEIGWASPLVTARGLTLS